MAGTVLEAQRLDEACAHSDVEVLGSEGGAWFTRCRHCGRFVVVQAGRRWTLRPGIAVPNL